MLYPLSLLLLIASPSLVKSEEHLLVEDDDDGSKSCTVLPYGDERNDVPNIREAFDICGKDGTIVFPEENNYWIAEKLHVTLDNSKVEWRGEWTVSPHSR